MAAARADRKKIANTLNGLLDTNDANLERVDMVLAKLR